MVNFGVNCDTAPNYGKLNGAWLISRGMKLDLREKVKIKFSRK